MANISKGLGQVRAMIGVSSSWYATKGLTIKQSVEKIFSLGFDLVELGAAHTYEKNAIETVRQLKKKYLDKKFTVHGLFPPLEQTYFLNIAWKQNQQKDVKIIEGMFDVARIVDAEVIGLHGGSAVEVLPGGVRFGFVVEKYSEEISYEEAIANSREVLETVKQLSKQHGVKVAVETESPTVFRSITCKPDLYRKVVKSLLDSKMGVLFDLCHLRLSSKKYGFDVCEFLEEFKSKVFQLHVSDVKENDTFGHWAVGTGTIDFKKYFGVLGSITKKIPIVFEHHNKVEDKEVLKGKEIIERIITDANFDTSR